MAHDDRFRETTADRISKGNGALCTRLTSIHLCSDVVEGWGADDGEAYQEDIRLGIGEWAQSIVILLSRSIPKT